MELRSLLQKTERVIRPEWAEEWDNTGLAVGDPSAEVTKIAVALDVTEKTVRDAIGCGCELLFTHHPVIFRPLGSLTFERPAPRAIRLAVKNDLALYSAHTNWDSSPEGVNVTLAKLLGLRDLEPIAEPPAPNGAYGLGAVGELGRKLRADELIGLLKSSWNLTRCEIFADGSEFVRRVAVGGGSCGSMWPAALEKGADIFVTADLSYHDRGDASASGLIMAAADHGEMERASLPALASILKRETGLPVEELGFETPPRIYV